MKPVDFELRPPRDIRLDSNRLNAAMVRLFNLTAGWEEGSAENAFTDLVATLRARIKEGMRRGESFGECTAVRRREATLLALYLNDLGDEGAGEWLPSFDQSIAVSVLGEAGSPLKKHLRRLATQLYFTHFGRARLPCLDWLSSVLRELWRMETPENLDPAGIVWFENANILFAVDAPSNVADLWKPTMSVEELADSLYIHQRGLFRERLIDSLILNRLRRTTLDENDGELSELVVKEKERILESGQHLGSAAVQILVQRTQAEKDSQVPEPWCEQLVTFACDPRLPNKQEQHRWWGWATGEQKNVVLRALSKLNIEAFIRLLEMSLRGPDAQRQFPERRDFLLNLFRLGKVIDARLVVCEESFLSMDNRTKKLLRPNWVSGIARRSDITKPSFVCLRCVDDVYIIEGTHNFAFRGFIGEDKFPIQGFWQSDPKCFKDYQFRTEKKVCSIYQPHNKGSWIQSVHQKLRTFHIEWQGLF